MNTVKARQNLLNETKSSSPLQSLTKRIRSVRLFGLQFKLIVPFFFLTMALALVGLFIITTLAVDSERERFQNNLLDASRVANDEIVTQENNQLERLRYLVFSEGMAQALYDKDSEKIYSLMQPIIASESIDVIATIDKDRKEVLTYVCESEQRICHRQKDVDFAGVQSVQKALEGTVDAQGDKYVEILNLDGKSVLFTTAPVQDANQQKAGVIMVGNYLSNILTEIKKQSLADAIALDSQGKLLDTTFKGQGIDQMAALAANLHPDDKTRPQTALLNERNYQVAYSPLIIRDQTMGWLGVFKNSDYLVSQVARSRDLFILVFSIGTFFVIVIGLSLARSISSPLLKLRNMSQAVADGNLDQRIGLQRGDEIGDLANAFDTMTLHLKERTDETERLYAESLQRNKELAEINAQLKATQLQLIQSEKLAAIGQLTAGIVHDVKNPFAVIMGMAEVLADNDQLDEETIHGLKIVRESAVKGNRIVSDLLKFARQTKPEMKTADLSETVDTALRLTAYLTRRYTLEKELPESPLMVNYDSQQIEQVLINMIHNAIQAMPEGGKLFVGLTQTNNMAQVIIQDNGKGIPPEDLKRIFDPFFTTKPEGEGTGLGLSVSYGIIANHNGRIDVESEVGQGTKFTIFLPLSQPFASSPDNEEL
jgi:signal transduction histidine kinase